MYYLNVTIFDSISYPKIFDRNVFRVRSTRISSILLVDSLSSASMFDFNLYPCASINISKYMFFDKYSLVPTTSVFVEVCIHLLFSGFVVNDSCSKSRYANCMTSHIRVYCMCWVNERQDSKQVPRSSKFLRPQLFVLANSFYTDQFAPIILVWALVSCIEGKILMFRCLVYFSSLPIIALLQTSQTSLLVPYLISEIFIYHKSFFF